MSTVSVKFNKFSIFPEILIDGEAISRYMTLTNYIYNDYFLWAELFYEVMDGELAEPYVVELTGHPYHEIAFNALKSKSEYCSEIQFNRVDFPVPVVDKYRFIQEMNSEYNVISLPLYDCIDVNCDDSFDFGSFGLSDVVFNERESDFRISDGSDTDAKYTINVTNSDRIIKQKNGAVICVTGEHLQTLIDYLNIYHLRLKAVQEFVNASSRFRFDEDRKTELDAYINESVSVKVSAIPSEISVGENCEISYKVFPKTTDPSYVSFQSSNPGVIRCSGNRIEAIGAGSSVITVKGKGGEIFRTGSVNAIKHNYVETVALALPSFSLKVGETMNFRIMTTPDNAEDAGDVKVSVNNPKVAMISGQNELYALAAGRVCITAETKRVSSKVYLSVIPEVAGLLLPVEKLNMPVNAVATLGCSYYPGDASPKPDVEWQSSDTRVATIEKRGEYGCKITSRQRGKTLITCTVKNSTISKAFELTVTN